MTEGNRPNAQDPVKPSGDARPNGSEALDPSRGLTSPSEAQTQPPARLVWNTAENPKTSKVYFWAANETLRQWESVVERSGVASLAELIRRSVQLYSILRDAVDRGSVVEVHDEDGTVRRLDPSSL